MKKSFYCLFIIIGFALQAQATDRYVNPSLWPSLPVNTYMTVTAALTAAQSGDRIYIAPGAYATPDLTISQNIEIYSMDTTDVVLLYNGSLPNGTGITINAIPNLQVKINGLKFGNFAISGATNMIVSADKLNLTGALSIYGAQDMQCNFSNFTIANFLQINGAQSMQCSMSKFNCTTFIINGGNQMKLDLSEITTNGYAIQINGYAGMNCTLKKVVAGSITGTAVTNGSSSNRAKVNLIDCLFTNGHVDFNNDYYDLDCIRTQAEQYSIVFRFGSVIASKARSIFVEDEPNGGNVSDTINKILIAADTIGTLNYRNDNYKMCIANNLLANLYVHYWNWYAGNTNKIINNEFIATPSIWNGNLNSTKLIIATSSVPYYNFDFSNNVFPPNQTDIFFLNNSNVNCGLIPTGTFGSNAIIFTNFYEYSSGIYSTCNSSSQFYAQNIYCQFPNRDISGFFKWTYNGFPIQDQEVFQVI